jgi:hypothetical protein
MRGYVPACFAFGKLLKSAIVFAQQIELIELIQPIEQTIHK